MNQAQENGLTQYIYGDVSNFSRNTMRKMDGDKS